MNKEQAATELGITVRTLQRHMAAHRIGFETRRSAKGEEAFFSPKEIARFKRERDALTTTVTPSVALSEGVSPTGLQALQTAAPPVETLAIATRFADALQTIQLHQSTLPAMTAAVPLADKLALTIPEAAALGGVSVSHLRDAIKAGKLKATIIGRGYRVAPDALRLYVGKLLK